MENNKKTEFIGTKEAARMLNLSPQTISKYCRDGVLQGAEQDRKGSPWRIPRKTIEEILENAKRKRDEENG